MYFFFCYLHKNKLTRLQMSQVGELSAIPICRHTLLNCVFLVLIPPAASAIPSPSASTTSSLTTMLTSINEIYNYEDISNL